jgi:hypothetical protein
MDIGFDDIDTHLHRTGEGFQCIFGKIDTVATMCDHPWNGCQKRFSHAASLATPPGFVQ